MVACSEGFFLDLHSNL